MKRNLATALLGLLALSACSKAPSPTEALLVNAATPQAVSPQDVETIVITKNASDQAACQQELLEQKATLLYSNTSGMILVAQPASKLKLDKCQATFTPNTPLTFDTSRPESRDNTDTELDLPTLLRLIPAEEIGARSFIKENPSFDGRGVKVAILDTGIELDHPMLTKTSDGRDKIVDFEDFSGEGRVLLDEVELTSGSLTTSNGIYQLAGVGASAVQFGIFAGSTLIQSERLKGTDVFKDVGVVVYRSGEQWAAKIDTNHDKNFNDELEISTFGTSRKFVKLGLKHSLTTAISISKDGKVATLLFDDGSHGTHVAGIAAGFDPNGLQGVAPGAQVIAAKIGDNRLAGGSTTTASMLLAIDYAVLKGAQVVNLSYGIRSGTNIGKSTIDAYVDRIALEKGILFSISAGNEGPGLLTVGTPAAANLAITNGAYISRRTAKDNYGYADFAEDGTWFFSSVGPRLDGGLKPTLLAPGTALSSVPIWFGMQQNFRGTSMASPQVTGGLALVVSAGLQSQLPTDRVSVTRAVYASAKPVTGLSLVEQGHGLMNVPSALKALQQFKAATPVEYLIGVNSPTSPDGKGSGIFVRSHLFPANAFSVTVTPTFPADTSEAVKAKLRTVRLEPSATWIQTPENLWIASQARTFQVNIDPVILTSPGLHSEKISGIDEQSGETLFTIPVTIVSPHLLNEENHHHWQNDFSLKVGKTQRFFVNVPTGATGVSIDLETDGPVVWGQVLDSEGRKWVDLRDPDGNSPLSPILQTISIKQPGIIEIDVVNPPNGRKTANVSLSIKANSVLTKLSPPNGDLVFDLLLTNFFDALKVTPKVTVPFAFKKTSIEILGNGIVIPFEVNTDDAKKFSSITFTVRTSKRVYDLMTDYPYRIFDSSKNVILSGGLELETDIEVDHLEKLTTGTNVLEIQGAFTEAPPLKWTIEVIEKRNLITPQVLLEGAKTLIEPGQTVMIPVDLSKAKLPPATYFESCPVVTLSTPGGREIQKTSLCSVNP